MEQREKNFVSFVCLFAWTVQIILNAKWTCTDNSQGSVLWWFTVISPHFQGLRQTLLPYPYLTQYTPPPVHPKSANEYFSKSEWILLLSQMCWHKLHRYRWGISGRHAQSTGVMYWDIMGLGHFSFLSVLIREGHMWEIYCSYKGLQNDYGCFCSAVPPIFNPNRRMQHNKCGVPLHDICLSFKWVQHF